MPSDKQSTNAAGNNASDMTGQYHSIKGNIVELVGNYTGATAWKTSGQQEHLAGEREINEAQAQAFAQGMADRAEGKIDAVVGAVTGDRQREISGNAKHDIGKTA
ncbi:hypothetical protein HETIRDRAFT_427367 [Heterobasidion irregulare TC 32-1]|uniref:CsbD-like domain-containing protein n=1 Tax=Heterobasidion irregulare (strain TC 32-1) TaxID=747525 RepID=W4K952_HETIT|nr:uncharacterized protein HETIRDRAFT_427367 [Heterobasidion irregulare TC 32-1]ETW82303.1 hypothetical protein HETIRDRAFT_427367 [Heterobasidion irregulare TC 32-1]